MALLPPGINSSTLNAADDVVLAALRNGKKQPHVNRGAQSADDQLDALKNGVGPEDLGHEAASSRNAAAAVNAASHAGVMDKAVGAADFVAQAPNKVAMYAVLPLMLGGWATRGAGQLIDKYWYKTPDKIGKISEFGFTMRKPTSAINLSFEDAAKMAKVDKPLGAAGGWFASTAGAPMDWLANATGLNKWRAKRQQAHIDIHMDSVNSMLKDGGADKIKGALQKIPELKDFHDITDRITQAKGNPAAMADLHSDLHTMERTITNKVHPRLRTTSGVDIHSFATSASDAAWHNQRKIHWQENRGFRDSGQMLKKAPVAHTAWNASFVAMDSIAMYGTATTFAANLHSLKQMYADMTGTDVGKVSTMKILTGSVPKPVAEARTQLLKHAGVDIGLQGFGLLFSLKQMLGGHMGGKAMMLQAGTAFGGEHIKKLITESVAPFYGNLSAAHARGEHIPAQVYAEFLTRLDPVFARQGAEKFTMAAATKLAHENTSPGAILKLQAQGKLKSLGQAAAKEMDAAHPAPQAHHDTKHVDVVTGKNAKNYAVQGPHTHQVVTQKAQQHTMPAAPERPQ